MTGELEPDKRGQILQLIREEFAFPTYGRVTKVWPHSSADDQSNHEVSVLIPPGVPEGEPRRMPIVTPSSGEIRVPQSGDLVLVDYIGGNGDRPVVVGHVYGDQDDDRAPLGQAGDVRVNRGDLYAEVAGDGSSARLSKKADDLDSPSAEVGIDDTGKVTIETDGDVVIRGTSSVTIDQGGTPKAVLTEDAKFDYSGSTSDGASYSGTTTTVSNGETTSTQVE